MFLKIKEFGGISFRPEESVSLSIVHVGSYLVALVCVPPFIIFLEFDICGSVHHHLINKKTNVMQLGAIGVIIPWKTLYMFRVLFAPLIRSVLKLYMQLLVQSCIGMVSDPVCYKMIRSRERAACGWIL
jgi:hypothetical protein